MSLPTRLRQLSIASRTFLLVLVALVIAEGIAVALFVLRPPLRNPPVPLHEVAEQLRLPTDGSRFERAPPPGPRFGGFDGPDSWDDGARSPGPPPSHRPARPEPPPRSNRTTQNLEVEDRAGPPAQPDDADTSRAAATERLLAQELGVEAPAVRILLPRDPHSPFRAGPDPGERLLDEGFVAARRLPDGRWRTVTSQVDGFPNAFHRQALLLFVLGLALLLPLAWLFARALSAPIRRFAEGARRLGQDPSTPPLPRGGPREMQQAVDAFNTMQARLTRLLQERTQMVGAIAHDLRTPLTRLAFRLEDLPSPLREKVDGDIQEMKSMIGAALDFLRDRALTSQREPLDLRLLVERIVDDHVDQGQDVSLAAGAPVTIHGAPLALRRMVVNLVENALKYGLRARLRLQVVGGQAVLEIDDDGPGIPESQLQQVFEPFYRLEGSRNRDTGGIGLGLATARAIALDHGGELELTNRGNGSSLRASVRLPLPE